MEGQNGLPLALEWRETRGLWGHRDLLRQSPHTGTQFPGASHDHSMSVLAAGAQLSIAFTEPSWRLPTAILQSFGPLFQPELEMPTDFGGIPRGPGAFDEGTACLGVASFGDRALVALVARGIC